MTNPTVSTPETTGEPAPYAEIAAELRRMADALAGLTGLPKPGWVTFDIQPADGSDDERVAGVDAVAGALLGMPGKTKPVGGSYHHGAKGWRGPIGVNIYQSVSSPEKVELEAELKKLRAEAEALRSELASTKPAGTGLDYTDLDDRMAVQSAPVPAGVEVFSPSVRPVSGAGRP